MRRAFISLCLVIGGLVSCGDNARSGGNTQTHGGARVVETASTFGVYRRVHPGTFAGNLDARADQPIELSLPRDLKLRVTATDLGEAAPTLHGAVRVFDGTAFSTLRVPLENGFEEFRHHTRAVAEVHSDYRVEAPARTSVFARNKELIVAANDGLVLATAPPPVLEDARGVTRVGDWIVDRAADGSFHVRVSWPTTDLAFPVLADPAWTAFGTSLVFGAGVFAPLPDGRLLVAGGYTTTDNTPTLAAWFVDSTGARTAAPDMPAAVEQPAVVPLSDGRVFVSGKGGSFTFNGTAWTTLPSAGINGVAGIQMSDGRVVVTDRGGRLSAYSPTTNAWTSLLSSETCFPVVTSTVGDFRLRGLRSTIVATGSSTVAVACERITPGVSGLSCDATNVGYSTQFFRFDLGTSTKTPITVPTTFGTGGHLLRSPGKVWLFGRDVLSLDDGATSWVSKRTGAGLQYAAAASRASGRMIAAGGGSTLFSCSGSTNASVSFPSTASRTSLESDFTVMSDPTILLVTGRFMPSLASSPSGLFIAGSVEGRFTLSGTTSLSVVEAWRASSSSIERYVELPKGAACGGACAAGLSCRDGVCCDSSCSGLCVACTAALKGSGVDGECGPVAVDTDPKGSCAVGTGYPGSCGADGLCDGTGTCRTIAKKGVACGTTTCTDGKVTGSVCAGTTATCVVDTVDCAPFACDATACKTTCTADTDCVATAYCTSASVCVEKADNGVACSGDGRSCKSGICADGVCCNSTCTGQCESCSEPTTSGTCTAVSGAPRGTRPTCDSLASTDCAKTTCDGATRDKCGGFANGTSTPCGDADHCMTDGRLQKRGACNGLGACGLPEPKSCLPFVCDLAAADGCKTSCATTADCAAGFACIGGKCTQGATCSEDKTSSIDKDGVPTSCAPYRCGEDGTCKQACATTADCATGSVCDPSSKCVAPVGDTDSSGGCTLSNSARGSDGNVLALLTLLGIVSLARRRSSERRA